jgi:type II secretory pathway pseudopilin PulG
MRRSNSHHARAFTLTELLVAVGVLVVVIVSAAQIFGSVSKVAGISEASADLLQTAASIESQIRADFANLPRNGFMVIQQVEVNEAGQLQTPIIDPSLGSSEIRADQIAFFTRGARTTTQYTGSQNVMSIGGVAANWMPEAAIARVYYGHGVLAPTIAVGFDPTTYNTGAADGAPIVPWLSGTVETKQWNVGNGFGPQGRLPATKPSNWPLARIATLMGTDGSTASGQVTSAYAANAGTNATQRLFTSTLVQLAPLASTAVMNTLADPLWTSSRVDIVKWQPDDLFTQMAYQYRANGTLQPTNGLLGFNYPIAPASPWNGSSTRLRMIQTLAPWATPATGPNPAPGSSALYVTYPRVEKAALGPAPTEQMLTAPVLAANCSSFKVEWTWADGTGRDFGQSLDVNNNGNIDNGEQYLGMYVPRGAMQPWFGLDEAHIAGAPINSMVRPASNSLLFRNNGAYDLARCTIGLPLAFGAGNDPVICSAEGAINSGGDPFVTGRPIWRTHGGQGGKRVYQAVFGFNQDDSGVINPGATGRGPYTPMPSAIRVTVRLHDPLGRIEGGRDYQFIIDLPSN